MPVSHAHVHRQCQLTGGKALFEAPCLSHRDLGEGRDAAEPLVVPDHVLQPVGRDPPAAENVGEKGTDVGRSSGAAERDDQHGVERVP